MRTYLTTLVGAVLVVGLSACVSPSGEEKIGVAVQHEEDCMVYTQDSESGEYLGGTIVIGDVANYFGPDDLTRVGAATFCESLLDPGPALDNEEEGEGGGEGGGGGE